MSQTQSPASKRSVAGMIGAMGLTLLVVLGWWGLRELNNSDPQSPVRTVEWQSWLRSGQADGTLAMFAPATLPHGWRATSADYVPGVTGHWHVGMLTAGNHYVGLEESHDTTASMVHQFVDPDAVRGDDVVIGSETWQTWTDAGGDYAVVRTVAGVSGDADERLLVVGTAPPAQIRAFAGSLFPATPEG